MVKGRGAPGGLCQTEPVRVIASGRASEILDLGGGRVLRRFKGGGRPAREAMIMEHARAHGFPVPRVLEVLDGSLVLERVDGPTMLNHLRRRPWAGPRNARMLAMLHARLHEIPFEDKRLLHLDLHPDNILLSRRGPVVIDWTNARAGDPALDVALTWVIGVTSAGLWGRAFMKLFLRHVDREAAQRALKDAVAFRLADAHVTALERERVRRLLR
jgi:tRNA A-37 threonylcarbamoyl transferase component Bud32